MFSARLDPRRGVILDWWQNYGGSSCDWIMSRPRHDDKSSSSSSLTGQSKMPGLACGRQQYVHTEWMSPTLCPQIPKLLHKAHAYTVSEAVFVPAQLAVCLSHNSIWQERRRKLLLGVCLEWLSIIVNAKKPGIRNITGFICRIPQWFAVDISKYTMGFCHELFSIGTTQLKWSNHPFSVDNNSHGSFEFFWIMI